MDSITQIWKKIQAPDTNPSALKALVEEVKQAAMVSESPAKVNFGTSGWRGEIGSEFTLRNLQVVASAILKMYREATPELWESLLNYNPAGL